ncbi:MAG: hypothetical protein ACI8QS_002493 [Planctomycetota bacterium]|jgi:hypothetical protein
MKAGVTGSFRTLGTLLVQTEFGTPSKHSNPGLSVPTALISRSSAQSR